MGNIAHIAYHVNRLIPGGSGLCRRFSAGAGAESRPRLEVSAPGGFPDDRTEPPAAWDPQLPRLWASFHPLSPSSLLPPLLSAFSSGNMQSAPAGKGGRPQCVKKLVFALAREQIFCPFLPLQLRRFHEKTFDRLRTPGDGCPYDTFRNRNRTCNRQKIKKLSATR